MNPTESEIVNSEAQVTQPVAEQPKAEEHRIPKERLDQEIAKRRALEEALDQVRAEAAALKNKKTDASVIGSAEDLLKLREDVAAIKQSAYRSELKSALNLQSDEQTKVVHELLVSNPDLKPSEALIIASHRNADLFGGKDQRTFQPGLHSSLSAKGSGMPEVETLKDRVKKVGSMSDPIARAREEQRLHGKELARLMGLPRTD